jgi:opacity protein-like surface antigen
MKNSSINFTSRWALVLALAGFALAAGSLASAQTGGNQPAYRSERPEFTLFYRQFTAPTITRSNVGFGDNAGVYDGTFTIDTSDLFGFTWGYNYGSHLNINLEMALGQPDYKATWGPSKLSGTADMWTGDLNAEYNILKKRFTPFVGVGIGFLYFDSNIPEGDPDIWCWWDYYWGYVCTASQSTHTSTQFTWNATAGLRWEVTDRMLVKASYKAMWTKVGQSGNQLFPQYSLSAGWLF